MHSCYIRFDVRFRRCDCCIVMCSLCSGCTYTSEDSSLFLPYDVSIIIRGVAMDTLNVALLEHNYCWKGSIELEGASTTWRSITMRKDFESTFSSRAEQWSKWFANKICEQNWLTWVLPSAGRRLWCLLFGDTVVSGGHDGGCENDNGERDTNLVHNGSVAHHT